MKMRHWLSHFLQQLDYQVWLVTIIYFLFFTSIRYGLSLEIRIVSFLLGTALALPLVTLVEAFINLKQSLYQTLLFQLLLFVIALFAFTSTVHGFGKGIIVSLLFSQLVMQARELIVRGNFASWFGQDRQVMTVSKQRLYLLAAACVYTLIVIYLV